MQWADTLVDMSREQVKSTTVFLFEHLNRLGYDGWIVKSNQIIVALNIDTLGNVLLFACQERCRSSKGVRSVYG